MLWYILGPVQIIDANSQTSTRTVVHSKRLNVKNTDACIHCSLKILEGKIDITFYSLVAVIVLGAISLRFKVRSLVDFIAQNSFNGKLW